MVEAETLADVVSTQTSTTDAMPSVPAPAGDDALVVRLKSVHQRLAGRSYTNDVSAEDRRGMVEALTAAGSAIGSGAGRDWLRSALFFWVNEQASHGERERFVPAPALNEYTGASPSEPILAWLNASTPAGPAPSAWAPELGTADPASSGPIIASGDATGGASAPSDTAAPTSTLAPQGPAMGDTLSGVVAGSSAAAATAGASGAVAAPASAAPAPAEPARGITPRGGSPSTATAAAPPPLATAGELTDEEARRLVRISALARQWRLTDKANRKGFLIDDRVALLDAYRFTLLDPDIRDLVQASEAHIADSERAAQRRKFIQTLLAIATFVFLLLALTAALIAVESRRAVEKAESEQLAQINAAEKQRNLDDLRLATDALKRQEIQPLVTALKNLGVTDMSALGLLELKPVSEKDRNSDTITKLPNRMPVSLAAEPTQQDLCVGYIGLGSKGPESRLGDHRDPATVAPGDVVTLDQGADIVLRSGLPDPANYSFAPQSGVVPAGATIKILGAPVTYKRNPYQVWAQVSVPKAYCTTVYVQYTGSKEARTEVLNALGGVGVVTPPAQLIPTARGLAEIRYYWTSDKPVADQVAAALSRFNKGKALKVVPLLNYPTRPASGIIEVWVDLST